MAHDPPLPLILASGSPRRRELFERLGLHCTLAPADIDERAIEAKTPREYAIKTAYAKACAVEAEHESGVIVAADTIVVLEGEVFPKPDDERHAVEMLSRLSGRTHMVITGIIVKKVGGAALLDAENTLVTMKALDGAVIRDYVATGEPMDKAGAYGAQGLGRVLIEKVEGDFLNVIGLPVRKLMGMLDEFGSVDGAAVGVEELYRELTL